jgi:hypothetical protein
MTERRRFPPPWTIEERQESFIVKDADGNSLPISISRMSHSGKCR